MSIDRRLQTLKTFIQGHAGSPGSAQALRIIDSLIDEGTTTDAGAQSPSALHPLPQGACPKCGRRPGVCECGREHTGAVS